MSNRSEYRKAITGNGFAYSELVEFGYDDGKENLIPESAVIDVINDIESDVNDIIDLLNDITGLTEIDRIKADLEELSLKLY